MIDKEKILKELIINLDKLNIVDDEKTNFIDASMRVFDFDEYMCNKYNITLEEVKIKHDLYFNDKINEPEFQIIFNDALDNGKEGEILFELFDKYARDENYDKSVGADIVYIYSIMSKYTK